MLKFFLRGARRPGLLAACLLVVLVMGAGRAAWAQYMDKYYNPDDYTKEPARWKAPPVPKPYSEDAQFRYYTLTDFHPNDKNLRKFFTNTDDQKHPLVIQGQNVKFGICYRSQGEIENFLEYWLAGRFKTFECTLTLPDGFDGRLYYYVYGDDKKLLAGDDLGKGNRTAHITLSVEGVRRLVIKTSGGRDSEKLRVVWVNPILTETKDDD